jgi:GR25 family glycosyltransferase involved in LPS biosynthesis
MENISHIVYINLDHRTERRTEIEQELDRMDLSAERFSAIRTKPGIIGCTQSHLAVLQLAKERGWDHVLILEDDFMFIVDKEVVNTQLNAFFDLKIPYDVLMVSHGIIKSEPFNDIVCRAVDVQTASGYLVHSRFYDTLIQTLSESLPLLISTGYHWLYANDQYWKRHQPTSQWFCMNVRIGKQRSGYSDNAEAFVDYPQ